MMQTNGGLTNCTGNSLKLFFRFHFGGLLNFESVIRFPYCILIFTAAFPFEAVIRH